MATTINSYSVSLSLDAHDYIRNSSLSRSETSSLTRQINQARTPAENYERAIRTLDKALASGAIDQAVYNRLLKNQADALDNASKKTSTLRQHVTRLVAGYVSLRALTGGVGGGIRLAADAQDAEIQFRVLLKSATAAQLLLSQIQQFAAATPFQFSELRDAGKMLLAFKFSSDEVIKTLTMLGNVSSATGSRIGELAELLGKAKVQNTIYSEDLNQLTGRGINVLDGLAARFGVLTDEVKKLASEGKIHFSDLEIVLNDLATGDYLGLMEEQSKGLNGQWSTLKDNLQSIQRDVGTGLLPLMSGLAEKGTVWAQQFKLGMEMITNLQDAQSVNEAADARIAAGNADIDWMKKQIALKHKLNDLDKAYERGVINRQTYDREAKLINRLSGGELKGKATEAESSGEVMSGLISSALTTSIDSIKTGAGGLMDGWRTFQEVGAALAMSGMANTEEITKAVASPQIASLEAHSQEAYQFLTAATKEKDDRDRAKEEREKQLAANAIKQRDKMTEWLSKINTTLENHGFAKARN